MRIFVRGLLHPRNSSRLIALWRTRGQALFCMIANHDEVKWQLLREGTWRSLEETRRCVLCEETFQGWQVRVTWNRSGVARLRCPTHGCHGTTAQWIAAEAPLFSAAAWREWRKLLGALYKTKQGKRPIAAGVARTRGRLPAVLQKRG